MMSLFKWILVVASASVVSACPAGQCSRGDDSCTPGPLDCDDCEACHAGKYCKLWDAGDARAKCTATKLQSGGAESSCPAGKFSLAGAHACTPCTVGKWSSTAASACTNCAAGKHAAAASATACANCGAGTYSSAGASECTSCAVGTYSAAAASTCTNCSAGTYVATNGTSNCIDCAAGQFQPAAGETACQTCSPGRFMPREGSANCTECADRNRCGPGQQVEEACNATTDIRCTPCPSGRYNSKDTHSASACRECKTGRYMPIEGSRECTPCEGGRSQPEAGQASCLPCDVGRWSSSASSTTPALCDLNMPLRHPAAVGCDTQGAYNATDCSCAELPNYAYPSETHGHPTTSASTPCEEIEISRPRSESRDNRSHPEPRAGDLRHLCDVFGDPNFLLNRTEMWVKFAHDYYLRGSAKNAAAIAREVCAERQFFEIPCLELVQVGSALMQAHDEACALAGAAGAEANAFAVMEVPLTAGLHCEKGSPTCSSELEAWWDALQQTQTNFEQRTSTFFHDEQQAVQDRDTSDQHAADSHALEANCQASADGFAMQVQRFQEAINATQVALQIDEHALADNLNDRISAARSSFENAKDPKFWESDEGRLAKDAAKVAAWVVLYKVCEYKEDESKEVAEAAAVGILVPGMAAVAVEEGVEAVAWHEAAEKAEEEATEAAKAFAKDVLEIARKRRATLGMGCGEDTLDDCLRHKQEIQDLVDKQEGFQRFLETMDALTNLTQLAIDHNPDHALAEIPEVSLQLADLDMLAASVEAQTDFIDAAKDDALHEDVGQLIGFLKNKLKALSGYYNAVQQARFYHSQNERFQQMRTDANHRILSLEEQASKAETYTIAKRLHMCHDGLLLLAQQTKAFEMMTLLPSPPEVDGLFKGDRSLSAGRVDLADPRTYSEDSGMKQSGVTLDSYEDRLLQAQRALGTAYNTWQDGKNDCVSKQHKWIYLNVSAWQLQQLGDTGRKAGDQVDDKPSSEIVQRDLLWAILSAAAAAA
eukprot:COSAG06_NODE_3247_length_5620_cov_3.982612_4_plen_998_part_01